LPARAQQGGISALPRFDSLGSDVGFLLSRGHPEELTLHAGGQSMRMSPQ
jgi:hypothetical protein